MSAKKRWTKKQWQKIGLSQAPPEELERAFDQAQLAIWAVIDAADEWGYTQDSVAALGHLAGTLQDAIEDAKQVWIGCLHDEIEFLNTRMTNLEKGMQRSKK